MALDPATVENEISSIFFQKAYGKRPEGQMITSYKWHQWTVDQCCATAFNCVDKLILWWLQLYLLLSDAML